MEFRIVTLGPFVIQVQVQPTVKLLSVQGEGFNPPSNRVELPFTEYPLAASWLLDATKRELGLA